jgi:CubicO group peptidase (beta-lactamase class C family)
VVVDANANQYSTEFGTLSNDGYIPITLDVYGDVGNELYASTFVKRSIPGYYINIGLTVSQLQTFISQGFSYGFVPTAFGVTGDGNNATFGAIMSYSDAPYWYWYYDMPGGSASTPGTFEYHDAIFKSQNYILTAVAIYGDAGAPLYIAAWQQNGPAVAWSSRAVDTSASLTAGINSEYKLGYRPTLVALNSHGIYTSIYQENSVGSWSEKQGLTRAQYKALYAAESAKGLLPISLRAAGPTAAPTYAAIFAKTDQPIPKPRALTIVGKAVAAYDAIEKEITTFMQSNSVRAGQLTIAKNGVVQYERAFTWAEAGYPITQTTSLFRLASCSKAFVEAAVQTLYDQKKLAPTTLVFPKLGFTKPGDARSNQITVQDLLDHKGGYDDTVVPDPVFSMRQIALDLGLKVPLTIEEFVKWIYAQPLQFAPGTKDVYSNTGYVILSYLISVVTGKQFIDYVNEAVMVPLGVKSGVYQTHTAPSLKLAAEVTFEDDAAGLSGLSVTSPVLVPSPYGGDSLVYEVAQGASSITTTATIMTTLIHTWLVYGNGPRPAPGNYYWQRDGSMPGTTCVAGSRGNDGIDFCFVFNTRNWAPNAGSSPPDTLANTINDLLDKFDSASERFQGRRVTAQPLPYRGDALLRARRPHLTPHETSG